LTIERNEYSYIIHCDHCSEYLEIETDDWEMVKEEMKMQGWRIQKDENDCWENVCSVCARIPGVLKISLKGELK